MAEAPRARRASLRRSELPAGRPAVPSTPRADHAVWEPSAQRSDPVELLEEQAATRVPELVPIRHGRMLVSPFTYYRGAALAMAADLASTSLGDHGAALRRRTSLELRLLRFPERHLFFDVNDFDETAPGPWEWDVKRLAVSLEIAGRETATRTRSEWRSCGVRSARTGDHARVRGHVDARGLVQASRHRRPAPRVPGVARPQERHRACGGRSRRRVRTTTSRRSTSWRRSWTASRGSSTTPTHRAHRGVHRRDRHRGVVQAVQTIIRQLRDVAAGSQVSARAVSVRRISPERWSGSAASAPKRGSRCSSIMTRLAAVPAGEAGRGVGARAVHRAERVHQPRAARRRGQRLMQAASDIFLGWSGAAGQRTRDYYIRQLRDWKGSADIAGMTPTGMDLWGACAGGPSPGPRTLGRPHRDRGVPGNVGRLRPGRRRFLHRLCEPERARLPGAQGRRGKRKARRRGRCLKSAERRRRSSGGATLGARAPDRAVCAGRKYSNVTTEEKRSDADHHRRASCRLHGAGCRASVAWYQDLFGMQVVMQTDDETVRLRILVHPECGWVIGLREYPAHADGTFSEFRTGLDHIAFTGPHTTTWKHGRVSLPRKASRSVRLLIHLSALIALRDPDNIQLELGCRPRSNPGGLRRDRSGTPRR